MKKKRVLKRKATRTYKARVKVRTKRTMPVSVTLPKHVLVFLKGSADRAGMPIESVVQALLAVQVHAMCERAA